MSAFEAKVLADSVSLTGFRLTTMVLTYPRFIHAEFMTHRVFSRNAASSRAIPVKKKVARIEVSPVEPVEWGVNKPGMQATELLGPEDESKAKALWHRAKRVALRCALALDGLKVHKQVANRIIEPWDWMTTIVTSTRWRNFDVLRQHKDADPNIRKLAIMRKESYDASTPRLLKPGEWHLPWVDEAELSELGVEKCKQVSAGRCARVSYLTHEGKRDLEDDIKLFRRLTERQDVMEPGHWTPVEHQATPIGGFVHSVCDEASGRCDWCHKPMTKRRVRFSDALNDLVCSRCSLGHISSGNLIGWNQFRKEFPNEDFDA